MSCIFGPRRATQLLWLFPTLLTFFRVENDRNRDRPQSLPFWSVSVLGWLQDQGCCVCFLDFDFVLAGVEVDSLLHLWSCGCYWLIICGSCYLCLCLHSARLSEFVVREIPASKTAPMFTMQFDFSLVPSLPDWVCVHRFKPNSSRIICDYLYKSFSVNL